MTTPSSIVSFGLRLEAGASAQGYSLAGGPLLRSSLFEESLHPHARDRRVLRMAISAILPGRHQGSLEIAISGRPALLSALVGGGATAWVLAAGRTTGVDLQNPRVNELFPKRRNTRVKAYVLERLGLVTRSCT
jgi:hypothetical protein